MTMPQWCGECGTILTPGEQSGKWCDTCDRPLYNMHMPKSTTDYITCDLCNEYVIFGSTHCSLCNKEYPPEYWTSEADCKDNEDPITHSIRHPSVYTVDDCIMCDHLASGCKCSIGPITWDEIVNIDPDDFDIYDNVSSCDTCIYQYRHGCKPLRDWLRNLYETGEDAGRIDGCSELAVTTEVIEIPGLGFISGDLSGLESTW